MSTPAYRLFNLLIFISSKKKGVAYEKTIRKAIQKGDLNMFRSWIGSGVLSVLQHLENTGIRYERHLTRGQRAKERHMDVGWEVEATIEGRSTGTFSDRK